MNPATETEVQSMQKLNPLVNIWTKPRRTVRYILENKKFAWVFLFVSLAGISTILDAMSSANIADKVNTDIGGIFFFFILLGPLFGLVVWALSGLLYWGIGKVFKGSASFREILKATAWANIPIVLSLLLWIPDIQVFKLSAFSAFPPPISPGEGGIIIASSIIEMVLSFWYIIILIKAIAEAHQFSSWKALGTAILPGGVMLIFVAMLMFVS